MGVLVILDTTRLIKKRTQMIRFLYSMVYTSYALPPSVG